MGVGSQQNTSVRTVYSIYWGASPERRHLSLLIPHTYTFHQALEEIVSQRIALKPRLFIHSYHYIQYCTTPDGYSGWLLRMAIPDDYSGWLLRMATLDYSGWLLRMATPANPDGYSGLLRLATPATGVLSALPKGQPGFGETTYQTSCLHCAGSFYLYDCRIRAGFPYISRRGLLPMLVCGLRSQATQP